MKWIRSFHSLSLIKLSNRFGLLKDFAIKSNRRETAESTETTNNISALAPSHGGGQIGTN